jgi:hypothetical protein
MLRAAREITRDMAVSDETLAAFRTELDNELLVDLVMRIAVYCGVVRLLATLQIDVEPEYQQYLDEFLVPKEYCRGADRRTGFRAATTAP